MELEIIMKAGLTEPQAKTYLALLKHGALTPSQIAAKTGETRTNTYALLDKLAKLKLVQTTEGKKTTYVATHPSNLEVLAEKRRRALAKNEQAVKANLNALTDIFYANSNQPGTKVFIGEEGIKEIYRDALRTSKTVELLRSRADRPFYEFIMEYKHKLVQKGVWTIALTPASPGALKAATLENDQSLCFERTMFPPEAYTGSVSIMLYGDKIAMIDYGETAVSTIITSPALADCMRQIFAMLREYWQKAYPQPYNIEDLKR